MDKQKKFGLHGHNMGTVDQFKLSECGGFDLQTIDFIGAPGRIRTCGLRIRRTIQITPFISIFINNINMIKYYISSLFASKMLANVRLFLIKFNVTGTKAGTV
jgi:hypothetical protein